jgi:hypothetical protein
MSWLIQMYGEHLKLKNISDDQDGMHRQFLILELI